MKYLIVFFLTLTVFLPSLLQAQSFKITDTYVKENTELNQLIFSIEVEGIAGDSVPEPVGTLDGAPVLAYVFPTNLSPTNVGFDSTAGIVALALTSHPDFDDTPLWDENADAIYDNDGIVWHSHWVVLENNAAVPGGLAVKATTNNSILPPTNPGMPMYMDSPGHSVIWKDHKITCTVPLFRMNWQNDFKYDGVTALMYVNTSNNSLPLLGVYEVFSIASGDLSLPYSVGHHSCDTLIMDISSTTSVGIIEPETVKIYPNPASTEIHLTMSPDFDLTAFDVQIFDESGRQVYEGAINSTNMVIPVTAIGPVGKYFINVFDQATGAIKGSKKLILF